MRRMLWILVLMGLALSACSVEATPSDIALTEPEPGVAASTIPTSTEVTSGESDWWQEEGWQEEWGDWETFGMDRVDDAFIDQVQEGLAAEQPARTSIFVIRAEVSEGEQIAQIVETNRIRIAQLDAAFVPDGAVLDLSELEGQVAVESLSANQVIVAAMFAPAVSS